ALALAAPYAGLAGLLALAASSPEVRPSAWQAVVAGFLVAVVPGGLGAARAVVAAQVAAAARGPRARSGLGALLRLLPDRPRSLVIGVAGALSVLLASGAVLVGASLAMNMSAADHLYDLLAPGVVGGVLLLLVELAFLPNAVIWGVAYAVGPGFSVGAGGVPGRRARLAAPRRAARPRPRARGVAARPRGPVRRGRGRRRSHDPLPARPGVGGRPDVGLRDRGAHRRRGGAPERPVGRPARRRADGDRGAVGVAGRPAGGPGGRHRRRDRRLGREHDDPPPPRPSRGRGRGREA